MSLMIEQLEDDCILIEIAVRTIHNCDARKMKDTLEGKEGVRYMEQEMKEFGFIQKEEHNARISP